jgi:hypothetical protein
MEALLVDVDSVAGLVALQQIVEAPGADVVVFEEGIFRCVFGAGLGVSIKLV